MDPTTAANRFVLDQATAVGLVRPEHHEHVTGVLADPAFERAVQLATSVHLHSKVEQVAELPLADIRGWGVETERRTPGYVKFGFGAQVHLIFSELDDFEEAHLATFERPSWPYLDHIGIDLRDRTEATAAAWHDLPDRLRAGGRAVVRQHGPVLGCYAKVDDKIWAFSGDPAAQESEPPVEIALGPLALFDVTVGCTLRPKHPAAASRQPA
ncbi:MAG: hypothetical protein HKN44_11360 [Ilumatobacter sp.]|nr:hypothetical protein [Ilumatobacter sp.]